MLGRAIVESFVRNIPGLALACYVIVDCDSKLATWKLVRVRSWASSDLFLRIDLAIKTRIVAIVALRKARDTK